MNGLYCEDHPLMVGLLLGSPQFDVDPFGRVSDVDPAASPFGRPKKT